jgi:hypothetical protein
MIDASIVAVRDAIENFLRRTQTIQLYAASANAPAIIDWPSTAAKGAPFCATVIKIVAKAIDGAAPNKPAKLFGRNISPTTAAETADGHIIGQDGSTALIAGHRIGTGLLLPAASSIAAITMSVAV